MALTVTEAAQRLGVTERQVRRLIFNGALRAERRGRDWLVDDAEVIRRSERTPSAGRPFAPHVAWAALWYLSDLSPDWLTPQEMSRLRRWLRNADADRLTLATRTRADLHRCRILPEYLDTVIPESGVVRGGLSAAAESGADIRSIGVAEVYCDDSTWKRLTDTYAIREATADANLTVRVPDSRRHLPILLDQAAMPAAVVAVDLCDSTDPRTTRAGRDLAAHLLEMRRS